MRPRQASKLDDGEFPEPVDDEVSLKREAFRSLAQRSQRVAYLCFFIATVVFFVGLATSFSTLISRVTIAFLIVGSIILAVGIQIGYAVRGAERHEEDSKAQRRQ